MIEKINFYDLYGYLLPGFVLLALLWLPSSWLSGSWPSVDLDSAVAVLILSYVVGFIMQSVATEALPSKVLVRTASDRTMPMERHPSDFILDQHDATFSAKFKTDLTATILKSFALDVSGLDSKVRADAFRLCRAALIARKAAGYAEQAQGMYSLARGLLTAVALSIPFFLGWGTAAFRDVFMSWHRWGVVATGLAAVAFLITPWRIPTIAGKSCWRCVFSAIAIIAILAVGGAFCSSTAAYFVDEHRRALWIALPFFPPMVWLLSRRKMFGSPHERQVFKLSVGCTIFAIGFDCAGGKMAFGDSIRIFGAALLAMLLALVLRHAYHRFAIDFATKTYRDFYSLVSLPPRSTPEGAEATRVG